MGYYVRIAPPYREGDEPEHRLHVLIKFDDRFPMILRGVTKRGGEVPMDDEMLASCDWADLAKINVTIRPYNHGDTSKGGTGVTAYLKELKVWFADNDVMDDDEAPW